MSVTHLSPAERAKRVFSYDDMFAAMCIMEEIADTNMPDASQPWEPHRQMWGIGGLRDFVIDQLATACDKAWDRAQERYDEASNTHTDACEAGGGTGICTCTARETPDPGSFDYEFVPFWLRECVDWSDTNSPPRVRGT